MFFKRKKKEAGETPVTDRVAGKVAAGIIALQTKLSNRINKVKQIKVILLGCCIVSGSLSIYFFTHALVSTPQTVISIEKLKVPAHFVDDGNDKISKEMYEQMKAFKKYMDSLGSVIRPTLLDSMEVLEKIYLQQQN